METMPVVSPHVDLSVVCTRITSAENPIRFAIHCGPQQEATIILVFLRVCVCVCVCVRERERGRKLRLTLIPLFFLLFFSFLRIIMTLLDFACLVLFPMYGEK